MSVFAIVMMVEGTETTNCLLANDFAKHVLLGVEHHPSSRRLAIVFAVELMC